MLTTQSLLEAARAAHSRLAPFRASRQRFKRFTFGSQWDDRMLTPSGAQMTEGDYAARNGRVPLTNNMIQRLVKTLVGHWRNSVADRNSPTEELDARALEEFLISGCAVQRVEGGEVENVCPDDFFVSDFRRPDGADIELVGMVHRLSPTQLLARFAGGSRQQAAEIRRHYSADDPADARAAAARRCLVYEVWTLEPAERLRCSDTHTGATFLAPADREAELCERNRRRARRKVKPLRWTYECATQWVQRFLSPAGMLLGERTAGRHPFAVRFYPLLDGEVHPFVEGLIDQQKYVNRLITLIDNMMSTSAKGVLLFPENEMISQMEWKDVQELWASYDGVIPYNPRPDSPGPRQIVTNSSNSGAYELLNLQMQLFQQISGVSSALRGDHDSGGNSAQLFDAQTRNSLAAQADLFRTFDSFLAQRDSLMKQ